MAHEPRVRILGDARPADTRVRGHRARVHRVRRARAAAARWAVDADEPRSREAVDVVHRLGVVVTARHPDVHAGRARVCLIPGACRRAARDLVDVVELAVDEDTGDWDAAVRRRRAFRSTQAFRCRGRRRCRQRRSLVPASKCARVVAADDISAGHGDLTGTAASFAILVVRGRARG